MCLTIKKAISYIGFTGDWQSLSNGVLCGLIYEYMGIASLERANTNTSQKCNFLLNEILIS